MLNFLQMKANNYTIVELNVPDFDKVKDFYGKVGFEVVWERKPEGKKGYLVIQRERESCIVFLARDRRSL